MPGVIKYRDWSIDVQHAKRELRALGFWGEHDDPLFCAHFHEAVAYYQQTQGLDDDGVIGDLTWTALEGLPETPEDPYGYSVPSGLPASRAGVLQEALRHVGKREVPNGSNAGPDVLPFLPRWARPDDDEKGPAWCAFFVGYVCKEALQAYPLGGHYGSVRKLWKRADALGFQTATPTPGDLGILLNGNGTGHVYWVLRLSPDDEHLYTVEGNCSNAVRIGRRSLEAPNLRGFITLGLPAAPHATKGELADVKDMGKAGTR